MAKIDDLVVEVAKVKDVEDRALAAILDLRAQLIAAQDAVNAGGRADQAIQGVIDALDANTKPLADAVAPPAPAA